MRICWLQYICDQLYFFFFDTYRDMWSIILEAKHHLPSHIFPLKIIKWILCLLFYEWDPPLAYYSRVEVEKRIWGSRVLSINPHNGPREVFFFFLVHTPREVTRLSFASDVDCVCTTVPVGVAGIWTTDIILAKFIKFR